MMTKELVQLMKIDSTSGKEVELANFIAKNYNTPGATLEIQEVGDGTINLFYKWGIPKIIFCTHLDTVPPYIEPRADNGKIFGRGACDAKGQIITAFNTCKELHQEGESDFGLLLVAGEEIGSKGAKVANNLIKDCRYVIVGEPTENKLIKAGKGIQLYEVNIQGISAHSGYPQFGDDAIERLRIFLDKLSEIKYPVDNLLGTTTYNIGMLSSLNAHNVLPNLVSFKIYFRTTFSSHLLIENSLKRISDDNIQITKVREDKPYRFHYIDGYQSDVVAFACDGPCLNNLGKCLLYGPGSIKVAHTDKEFINISDLEKAVTDLKNIFRILIKETE
ncbi:MAG: M20/M25/M40 family metallo-hydrolase [Bacteroidales bacterium]|nr:M20/M25/M40 family metallo-hydrolase [Bacteroidales bacterium]